MISNYSNPHLRELKDKLRYHRAALFFTAIIFLLLSILSFSPFRGAISFPRAHWNNGNAFDDAANITALSNFKKNGFFATKGNESRAGMVLQDYFSIPCIGNDGTPQQVKHQSQTYKDIDSIEVPLNAKTSSCYYHRTPPLHLWLNYAFLNLTHFHSNSLALLYSFISSLWIFALYLLLTQFVSKRSSLLTVVFFSTTLAFLGWTQAAYNQPYQNLFFTLALYYFHQFAKQRKGAWGLMIFSAAHSLCSFELIPMQIVYMAGLTFFDHSEFLKSFIRGATGIAGAILLFCSWVALFAIDQKNILEQLFSSMANRYDNSLPFATWFQSQWNQVFNILSETLVPFYLVVALIIFLYFFTAKPMRNKRAAILSFFFISAWAFHFVMPGHSSYHFIILVRAFIPFYLCLIAMTLEQIFSTMTRLTLGFKYTVIVILLSLVFEGISSLHHYLSFYWPNQYSKNIARKSSAYLISLDPLKPTISKIKKELKWEYYYFKNRLIDGKVPTYRGEEWNMGVNINHQLGVDFDWFFLMPVHFNKVEIIASKNISEKDCFIEASMGGIPKRIKLLKSEEYHDQYFTVHQNYFAEMKADWVKLRCRSSIDFYLYEVRIL